MDEVDVTVMIADVSGSTALYEDVGNVQALHLVSGCLDRLRDAIEKRGGQFISSKGDDVLCLFDDPQAALDVGVEMLEAISGGPLSLHAGIDFGPVIRARNDVFGDSVNMAARLATLANSGEVLCSQSFYDLLGPAHRAMLRFFGARQFKGKSEPANVYMFSDAEPGQATEITFADPSAAVPQATGRNSLSDVKAALRYRKETYVCTSAAAVSMGRSEDSDVVIPFPWVSRSHAFLEVRQDKLYLTDRSSSGTYVRFQGQQPVFARRETVLLAGPCTLSPARHPDDAGAQLVTCEVM